VLDESRNPSPIIVHCSAGVGRTGTLIGLLNIIEGLLYQIYNYTDLQKTVEEHKYAETTYPSIAR